MKGSLYLNIFYADVAVFLVVAVVIAWQKTLASQIRMLRLSGASLAAIPFINALRTKDVAMVLVALAILGVRAVITPSLISRAISLEPPIRPTTRRVNSTTSLLASGIAILFAFLITEQIVAIDPTASVGAVPIPFGVALIAVILLITRGQMATMLVAFLLFDNGISAVAFMLTLGVPAIVELGALLDVLFLILVLVLLAAKMRPHLLSMEIDELRELHE